MRKAALFISMLCLLLTLVPSFLINYKLITPETNKLLMLLGTIGWFLTAPFWMNSNAKA